ncbi:MAG TPA: hypothetical protein VGH38_10090, partial [Bryobacteraceae bacterium]
MESMTAAAESEFVESCNPDGVCAGCSRLGEYCAVRGAAISCADLVARDGFDLTDRPSAGVGCAACARAGHWCPAKGMSGGTALCLACGTGEICDQVKSVEKMRAGFGEFEESAPPECRRIEISDADRVVTEVAPVSAWAIKASLDPENLKGTGIRKTNVRWSNGSPRPNRTRVVEEAKPKMARVVKAEPEEIVMEKMTKLPEPVPLAEAVVAVEEAQAVPVAAPSCKRGCGGRSHRGQCRGAPQPTPLATLRKYRMGATEEMVANIAAQAVPAFAEIKEVGQMGGFFSKTECACGCENLLAQRTVDRGWRYIRGHKPKTAPSVTQQLTRQSKIRPAPVTELGEGSLKTSLAFVRAQYDELNKEQELAADELGAAQLRFESAREKKMLLIPLI